MNNQEPTSHFFTAHRLRLHYVDWGNSGAPTVILVHGGRDHCRSWDWVARKLRDDYHVVAVDLRGHGDSQHINDGCYSIISMVFDLDALINHLDAGPVSLIAHSLGGTIATRLTGLFPDKIRHLIALEGIGQFAGLLEKRASTPITDLWRDWFEEGQNLARRAPRSYPSIEDAAARMAKSPAKLSNEQVDHLTRHGIRENEDGTLSWKYDNYTRHWLPTDVSEAELVTFWNRITCPTLLCYGSDSFFSHSAEFERHRHFNNCELTVKTYEPSGHWIHHDKFEEFVGDIRRFLADGKLAQG